jgi:hydrogenase assembly chaperone HypC/HupF
MCLSTPGRVTQVQGSMAEIEIAGHKAWYNALSRPEVQVGDYVLTYANMIVDIISEEEAHRIQQTLQDMAEALEQEPSDESGGESGDGAPPDHETTKR